MKSITEAEYPGKDVRITATPDGTWLDDRKVSHEELADALKQLSPDTKILIDVDPSLRHKEFAPILEICGNAEMVHIEVAEPMPDHPSKSERATGIELDWGGVKMTLVGPRILPASMKQKIRKRMSPREIVTTFGQGWMSRHSSVGSISWRFDDASMIHVHYRPGTTLVDQAVDVYRYEPPEKHGDPSKTDDGIKNQKERKRP